MLNQEYKFELKNIAINAGIGAFGIVFLNIMAFVNNAIITRTLGADDYGLFVLATNILYFISIICQLGFGSTILRYISYYMGQGEYGKTKGTILYGVKILFIVSLIVSITAIAISPFISQNIFERPEMNSYLRILLLSLPFLAVTVIFNASLNGLKLIKYQVLAINILHPLMFFALISLVFLLGYRLEGLIWVVFVTGILGLLVSFFFLFRKYFKPSSKIKPEVDKKELWKFAFPIYLKQFFNNAILYIPIFFAGYFLTNLEVGVYNISFKIALMVSFSLGAFQLIFSPTISNLFAQKNNQLIKQLYQSITKWIFTISLITFFIIILFSNQLLSIFGEVFVSGSAILTIMVCGEIFNAAGGLAGNILIMSGRPKVALFNAAISFILILILSYFLIPLYGIIGAALSYAVTIALINVLRVSELYFFEKIQPFKLSYIKPVIAGVLVYLVMSFMIQKSNTGEYLELVIGSMFYLAFFFVLTWAFRLDTEDKYLIEIFFDKLKTRKDK